MNNSEKSSMPWTRAESETVIRRTGDQLEWDCYSCIRRDITKLRRIAATHGAEVFELDDWSIRVRLPYKAISFRNRSSRIGINPFSDPSNARQDDEFQEDNTADDTQ